MQIRGERPQEGHGVEAEGSISGQGTGEAAMAQRQVQRSHVSRRAVLRGAASGAVVTGIAVAAGGTPRGVRAEAGQKLEGSWINTISPAGPAPAFRTLATYHPDGTVITSPLPISTAPPGLGAARVHPSASHGEWFRIGDRTFAVTFVALLVDDSGAFVAMQKVRLTVTLDEGSNSFSAQFQATYTGADDTVLVAFGGSTQASRVRVEPL